MEYNYDNSMVNIDNFNYSPYFKNFEEKLSKGIVGFREAIYKDYKYDFSADKVIVVGMGGSILGTETLYYSLNLKNGYFLDNIDPEKCRKIIENIDKDTLIFIVSKSGNTLETIINYNLLKEKTNSKNFIFITNGGKLKEIAIKNNYPILNIPKNVPGRFSVLTNVGLAPLSALGVDINKILKGAREMDKICRKKDNPAVINGVIHYLHYKDNKTISVLFSYYEALSYFGEWYKQLVGESLGKCGEGITPMFSIGAKDQHSLLQLYLDGKKDKVITFLTVKKYRDDFEIEFNNKKFKLSEVILTEQLATEKSLTLKNVPNVKIVLDEINEKELGSLLYFYMYQIGFMGELFNINAFNQPAVELEKRICWELLFKH